VRDLTIEVVASVRLETNEYGRWGSTLPKGGKLPHLQDLTDQLFIAGAFRSYREAGRRYYFATSSAIVPDGNLMQAVDAGSRVVIKKPVFSRHRFIGPCFFR
jgi:hypothetical protein